VKARVLVLLLLAGCSRIAVDPARYSCTAGGPDTQCPGNWRCINDNFCVDPDAGGPWSCTVDTDCTGAWHCGREQHCYDLSDAGAITCRRDAGDCAPGWACGLDERCLDTSVANGNRCTVDLDCFANQRCSANRCITLGDEALRASDGGPTFNRGQLPLAGARLLAGLSNTTLSVLVGVVDGGVVVSHVSTGPLEPYALTARLERFDPAPLDPLSLAVIDDPAALSYSIAIVGRDGGAWAFERDDAGWHGTSLALGSAATGVRRLIPKSLRWAVFGDGQLAVGPTAGSLTPVANAPAKMNDVTALVRNDTGILIASTPAGGQARDIISGALTTGAWRPVLCTKSGPFEGVVMVREVTSPKPSFVAVLTDGGSSTVVTFEAIAVLDAGSGACELSIAGTAFMPSVDVVTLDVHDPTGVVASTNGRTTAGTLIGVGGTLADGTKGSKWFSSSADFTVFNPRYGALWSNTNASQLAAMSAAGEVWLEAGAFLVPQMPQSAPLLSLVNGQQDLLEGSSSGQDVLVPSTPFYTCAQSRTQAACLNTLTPWSQYVNGSAVRGHEAWTVTFDYDSTNTVIRGNVVDANGATLAAQEVAANAVRPGGGAATSLPDGGTLVMTRVLDYLSFAELASGALNTPSLRFAVSPLPRSELTDLVLTPASTTPDAQYAEAWAISSGRVFRVHASTPSLWRADEVPLPTDVEVVRLWLDGQRARGGDRLGVVFALGARVALSQPLPLGEVAGEYGSRCTNDFVLTQSGRLFQLEASAAGQLATWVERPTPARFLRLVEHGDELRGFDNAGHAYWLDGLSCLP
jgi:hypothetical protein